MPLRAVCWLPCTWETLGNMWHLHGWRREAVFQEGGGRKVPQSWGAPSVVVVGSLNSHPPSAAFCFLPKFDFPDLEADYPQSSDLPPVGSPLCCKEPWRWAGLRSHCRPATCAGPWVCLCCFAGGLSKQTPCGTCVCLSLCFLVVQFRVCPTLPAPS